VRDDGHVRWPTGILLLALAAAACASGSAWAAQGPPSPTVIKVRAVQTPGKLTDVPPDGPSRGDTAVVHYRLLNAQRQFGKPVGARIGHNDAILTVISKTLGTVSGRATLPGGTIAFGGVGPLTSAPGAGAVAILGGTGAFAGARGTISGNGRTPQVLTIRLAPA